MTMMMLLGLLAQDGGEIQNKIQALSVDLNFEQTPFEEAMAYLREFSGINIVVDPAAYEKHGKDSMKVSLKVKGVRLHSALKVILAPFDLAMQVKEGVLEITTQEKVNTDVVTRIYDVRDLSIKINNFPGPRLELVAGMPGISPSFGEEPKPPPIDQAMLEELVRETCGKETWEKNPNASLVYTPNGQLMVAQTREVHREIEKLVNMIRELR